MCFNLYTAPAFAGDVYKEMKDSNVISEVYDVVQSDGSIQQVMGQHVEYVYETVDGSVVKNVDKIKKIQDRRPGEKKHPILYKVRGALVFVGPFVSVAMMVFN